MFKAQRKDSKKIYTILDTYLEPTFMRTYFLIYENEMNIDKYFSKNKK